MIKKLLKIFALLIWGEQDRLIPLSDTYRFEEDLPNNRLVILENVGHVPMEEVPELVAPLIEQFIQEPIR